MALTTKEKLGAVAGFIPFVSTVSGIIKAFVYFKRAKKGEFENLNGTAKRTQDITLQKLSNQERKCNDKLWKASVVEIIPGVNIIAAVYSAFVLHQLSETRDLIKDPDKVIEKAFRAQNLSLYDDNQKNQLMYEVLLRLQERGQANNKSIISFCYGYIAGQKHTLTADQLIDQAFKEISEVEVREEKTREETLQNVQDAIKKSIGSSEDAKFD